MLYLVDDLYQQGLKLHGSGKVELACQVYTLVLNAHPEHSMANHSLGVLCVDIGKVQEALPFFEAALEANADVAQFWVSYIDALINVERIADAHAVFGQAKSNGAKGEGFDKLEQRLTNAREEPLTANSTGLEEKQPKHSNILDSLKLDQAINLAKKRVQEGATEEAKRIFQDILTKSPKNKRAGDGLKALASRSAGDASKIQDPPRGQLQALINLYSQSQLQEALKEAESLIQSFPQSAILFNVQGAVFKDLGRLDQSIEAYNKALATKPDYAEAYNNMGNTFKEQGKLEEAIEAYNKAIIIKPDNTDAYNNMGNAMKEQGKLEEAIGAYNKALDIKPDNANAYYNMGRSLQELGKLEEAIEAYNKSLAIKPDNADAYYNMGNALKEQDKLEEATEAYNKALAIKPNDADADYNMGVTLQGQGKLEEAIEAYNRALAIKPDYADAYNNMGNTLQDQGKLEEAIEAYHKALAIKPDYASAQHMVSSLTGKTTTSTPKQYVESLFDGYAKKFEQSLVENLEYKIPKMLTDIVVKENGGGLLGSVLDLGCGTGLMGVEIKDYCSNLEGIDLSEKMLGLADAKKVYDKLIHTDILHYLADTDLCFDYFIATDVLIYVGDLTELFRLIKSRNKRKGKLVFSTEHTELDGFQLEKTGRYSHSKTYIEELCAKFKYTISHFSMVNLRKDKGQFLTGGLYILDF